MKSNTKLVNPYPQKISIEGIPVDALHNVDSLFERIYLETIKAKQTIITYLNIHVANTALWHSSVRSLLEGSDLVYCDGEGIVMGSKILQTPLPTRLTAANWFSDFIAYCKRKNMTVFLLGGVPGVAETAVDKLQQTLGEASNSIIGYHHGFFLNDKVLEKQVIKTINTLKPDILVVGFGTPLQETWIKENCGQLQVSTIYALGAILDFVSETMPRCPAWMGKAGLEWLYRFSLEPKRLFARYMIGNPWFIFRIGFSLIRKPFAAFTRLFRLKYRVPT